MPNWKAIASALRRQKPQRVGAAAANSDVEVTLCQSKMEKDGRSFTYLYEIVRREAGKETISFQQFYSVTDGQALKLPQDLRISPKDPAQVRRSCRVVGPKGELSNA